MDAPGRGGVSPPLPFHMRGGLFRGKKKKRRKRKKDRTTFQTKEQVLIPSLRYDSPILSHFPLSLFVFGGPSVSFFYLRFDILIPKTSPCGLGSSPNHPFPSLSLFFFHFFPFSFVALFSFSGLKAMSSWEFPLRRNSPLLFSLFEGGRLLRIFQSFVNGYGARKGVQKEVTCTFFFV